MVESNDAKEVLEMIGDHMPAELRAQFERMAEYNETPVAKYLSAFADGEWAEVKSIRVVDGTLEVLITDTDMAHHSLEWLQERSNG